jgi:F0F1-type ATP synthase membrane subunit b/b'
MDATLHALADLLLESIPTVVLFLFLVYYLKKVFFIPVARILEDRRKATEGVRELSQRAFEAADKRSSEFETALQLARSKAQLAQDLRQAELELQSQVEPLSAQIISSLLRRRAA